MRQLSQLTLDAIAAEATRADILHKEHSMLNPEQPLAEKMTVLWEEYGEVGRALTYDEGSRDQLEKELIQLAAMAAAWVESLNS